MQLVLSATLGCCWICLAALKWVGFARRLLHDDSRLTVIAMAVEFVVGIAVLIPTTRRFGLIVSSMLAILFIAAATPFAVMFGLDLDDCGCFGSMVRTDVAIRRSIAGGLLALSILAMGTSPLFLRRSCP